MLRGALLRRGLGRWRESAACALLEKRAARWREARACGLAVRAWRGRHKGALLARVAGARSLGRRLRGSVLRWRRRAARSQLLRELVRYHVARLQRAAARDRWRGQALVLRAVRLGLRGVLLARGRGLESVRRCFGRWGAAAERAAVAREAGARVGRRGDVLAAPGGGGGGGSVGVRPASCACVLGRPPPLLSMFLTLYSMCV